MSTMLNLFTSARRAGVPILIINTADQADTIDTIKTEWDKYPLLQWDAARGIGPVNKLGQNAMTAGGVTIKGEDTIDFTAAMVAAQLLPQGSILFAHNGHRQLQSQEPGATAASVQAVANLRNTFKKNFRTLVILGPHVVAPSELSHDVVAIRHALPDPDALSKIITDLHSAVTPPLTQPKPEALTKAVDAVSGLSAFAAEQQTAMSLTEKGLDLPALWERKRITIEQTPGLSVWRGTESFKDIVGLDNVKAHLRRRAKAKTPVGVVVWIDEIDKALANVESDTSGVRMDQVRTLLMEMDHNEWHGQIDLGVSGGGKSLLAKAFGNEAGVPTIALDLGGMESKYVGESEAQLRQAMEVIKAIGRGHAYFMATSNNASVMRPELQRRFTDGLWFFDLMSDKERAAAWKFYRAKYEIPVKYELPDDDGWTGAEIRNACRFAWDTDTTLVEAAQFIVPMSQSRAPEIEALRKYAHGRCLDANKSGSYKYDPKPMVEQKRAVMLPPSILNQKES